MNCRDFLTEFEERKPLTEAAMLHLNKCAGCKKVSNQQTRVWQVCEALETVDVPKDFNFRVKARIASAKQADFQPRFLPALRYVLPLSLVVLVFGFMVINGIYLVDDSSISQVAQTSQQPFVEKENPPVISQVAPIETGDGSETEIDKNLIADSSVQSASRRDAKLPVNNKQFIAVKSKTPSSAFRKDDENTEPVRSRISSSTSSKVITPKNVDLNKTMESAPVLENKSSLTTAEILSQLGMETVSENGRLRVKSTTQNGIAARSGIKVGDIIEAIDGTKLTNEPLHNKIIAVKKINVERDGAKKEITLRN